MEADKCPHLQKRGQGFIKNYRPISLTCLVMKLFGRIFKEELLPRTLNHVQLI